MRAESPTWSSGDLAAFSQDGSPLPGVAQVAMQMGRHAARTILATERGEPRPEFRDRDKGNLATIGRAAAVADLGWIRLSGFIAWFAWLVVHIFFLIGFRNRVVVLIQWAWACFGYRWGPRLITGEAGVDGARARVR